MVYRVPELAAGSHADEWFADLPSEDKADMMALKAAFLKHWPPVKKPRWTRAQQRERIRALVLNEEDVGKWVEDESGGDYGHIVWATKVMRLAMNMGDTEGRLIECVIEEAPAVLRNELEDEYEGWDEFVEAVRKVKVKKMLRNREAKRGEQELRREVAELRQQMGQLAVRHTPQTYQPRAVVCTAGEGTMQAYWNQHAKTSAVPLAINRNVVVPRVPLTRAQILEKVSALPQRANTEVGRRLYEADVAVWHRTFGEGTAPALERPYPLKPGTTAVGSGECFSCGLVTDPPHVGSTCTTKETLRPHETRWRQLVAGMLRRAAQFRPQVFAVATEDEWHRGSEEQGGQQEDQWGWTMEGNL